MLDSLEPEQFQELIAATFVGLDLEGWKQNAFLSSAICNKLAMMMELQGTPSKFYDPADFLPDLQREVLGIVDKDESAKQLEKAKEQARLRFG